VSTEILYQHVSGEIAHLRDERWRLAYYYISLSAAVILLFANPEVSQAFVDHPLVRGIAIIVQICAIGIFLWQIIQTHIYLTHHRAMRRRLEQILGYHALTDASGTHVLPQDWRRTSVDRHFEIDIIILPLILFVLLLQMLSIWLVCQNTTS